jgi:superfamily II DNA or RNA helicase
MQHDIIDNRNLSLLEQVQQILPGSRSAKFAVGYFFLSGLTAVEDVLANVEQLYLLIGNTTNRETIEQIAEGYQRLAQTQSTIEAQTYPTRRDVASGLQRSREKMADTLATMPQDKSTESLVSILVRLIEEERLHIKVYTKGRLHAKAYIFDYAPIFDASGKPIPRAERGISIVGSSNFTLAGISHNTELNVLVHGNANHTELHRWFDDLWAEAEEFTPILMEELNRSWVREQVTPYEIYLKTLYELVRSRLDQQEDYVPLESTQIMETLTEFQERALKRAIRMIRNYGGCFISDVVGLGKSYIGAAIIKYFERTERVRPLIICPAPLVEMWEKYNEEHQLNARVISIGILREDTETGTISLLEDVKYRDRDFVLVDESHNFRHTDTQRYRVLEAFLATGRQCVLLSATPQNKSIWDIYNQIKLFHPSDETNMPIDPPNINQYLKLVEQNERQLPGLLSNILIRRTRSHILRWYGYDSITDQPVDPDEFGDYRTGTKRAYILVNGKRRFFPSRHLETIQYSIEETYQGLYQQLRTYLSVTTDSTPDSRILKYARYGLWHYVRKEKRDKPPYSDLQRAGANIRGLMRVSMFKRLESSVYAFRETLKRLASIHRGFLDALSKDIIAAGEEAQAILYESDRYDEASLFDALSKVSGRYSVADFHVDRLKKDIEYDLQVIEEMLMIVEYITPQNDAKLQMLIQQLGQPPLNKGKVLIFTQYADTARYLFENLDGQLGRRLIEVVYSGTRRTSEIIGRFAPKANPEYVPKGRQKQIDILIATDTLSEGLNLQDCDKVINYDLHWNPVRLIQRFGRIDRIGSEHDEVYGFNFLPETTLDKHLGLRERLSQRIHEIHQTLGEDSAVLDPEEQINEHAVYAIYEQRDINEYEDADEDDLVDLDEAEEIIRQLKRDDPELFEKITMLRDGIRCGRPSQNGNQFFMFGRSGNYEQLFLLDREGQILSRDIPYILSKMRCEASEPSRPLPVEHNQRIMQIFRQFSTEARDRHSDVPRALLRSPGQKYVQRELQIMFGLTSDEERRIVIQKLLRAYSKPLPRIVQRHLNETRRVGLQDEVLLHRLLQVFDQYSLDEIRTVASQTDDEEDNTSRIVCSTAFIS